MPLKIVESNRLQELPAYLFAELDQARNQLRKSAVDIIDLGVGDPDLPTPKGIIKSLAAAAEVASNHRYPPYRGMQLLREEIANWYQRRFQVSLDPEKEILVLIGSKDGIAHLPLALVNYGDYTLVPDPGYPVYGIATELAAGIPYRMPLLPTESYLPKLAEVPSNVANRAKLMFLNYPNNPTAALANSQFYGEAVQFARKYNVVVANDAAYSTLVFAQQALSLLQISGAKQIAIEFQSLSKMFNMTGWRIGFAAGNAQLIEALGKIKTNIDSGVFGAIQVAAAHALAKDEEYQHDIIASYQKRRDLVCNLLAESGLEFEKPEGTFFIWLKVPGNEQSALFCKKLLNNGGVVTTPGVGFGNYGEGFFRISLTSDEQRLTEACQRIAKVLKGEKAI